jgi:hypothetical protein
MNIETLMQFCAPADWQDERYEPLKVPFSFGDWTYFSDRAVIVRVARIYAGLPKEHKDAPGALCSRIFSQSFAMGVEIVIPAELPQSTDRRDKGVSMQFAKDLWLNATYLRMLKTLPKMRLYLSAIDIRAPLPFTFEGGSGLLMPFIKAEKSPQRHGDTARVTI